MVTFFELEIIWWTFFSSENFAWYGFFLLQSSQFYVKQLYPFSFKNMRERVPFFAAVECVMNSLGFFNATKRRSFFIQAKRTILGYVLGRQSVFFL